jgi:N-acetyl-gamma-glutamyl-phosphate reductase
MGDGKEQRLSVAVVGASGYAGLELLRLLIGHPRVRVTAVTSEQSAGKTVGDLYPSLGGAYDLRLEPLDAKAVAEKAEAVFVALPHTAAMEPVARLVRSGRTVIDLSADYRLSEPAAYERWYRKPHTQPDLLRTAVYGLPELHRDRLRKASLVANPGCYPTGALLGLAPLVREGLIRPDTIVMDAKSGISGAGRTGSVAYSFSELNEAVSAYSIGSHRHTPEIEQELGRIAGRPVTVTFTPHRVPMTRGILTTLYAEQARDLTEGAVREVFETAYGGEPFVRVLGGDQAPDTAHVRGSNTCELRPYLDSRTKRVVVVAAIDNLVKGAAGQAIQNLNLTQGWEETLGLDRAGMFP